MSFLSLCCCTQQKTTVEIIDLHQIQERGSLTVSVHSNSVDYFVYQGEPMGFQYEMLTELGKYLGLKIEFLAGKSYMENLQQLSEGHCDMIAAGLLLPRDSLLATNIDTLYMARQVLVQRKPSKWKTMSREEWNCCLIRHPDDLNGKIVYTSGWSSLMDGDDFVPNRRTRFVKLRGIGSERLIDMVANGELNYAICDRSEAQAMAHKYDHIDMQTGMGELAVGWLVRPTSAELYTVIAQWLDTFKKTTGYAVLYRKYHNSSVAGNKVRGSGSAHRAGGISQYDDLFRKYSREIGWDWRLLASLVCQESRFQPTVRSKRGAYGLMQMMPATLEQFGVDTTSTPEKHIAAGVAYIKYLDKLITPKVSDEDERVKFVLASYNIGPGHVFDAQRLAEKYGKDAAVWNNNVDSCLLSKAHPEVYTDPDVKYGKCKGTETCAFVLKVLERYEHYKNGNVSI